MSVFLVKNNEGVVFVEDNGVVKPIDKIVDGGKTYKLPENASNRQYFNIARFEKDAMDGRLELTYKPSVTIGTREGTKRQVKPLEDWLEGDDRALYLELKAKAQKARDEANTKAPMTELEKAQRRMERAQKALEKLLASENKEEK